MHEFEDQIPDQLAAGIRVLLYAGDQDFICNWLGNQAWVKALEWPHQADFNGVALKNVSDIGTLRSSNGLSFLQVFNAGHMVPRDQPKAALEMLTMFIAGEI
jgi:carboxypeptidase C (cathepsin A)